MDATPGDDPIQKFLRDIHEERIKVVIGRDDDATTFNIPKALLCKHSPWFAGALREGGFIESKTKTINLPEDCASTFKAFEYYVYRMDLDFAKSEQLQHDRISDEVTHAFQIWIFGDKYHVPGLQNCAMIRICEILKWLEDVEVCQRPEIPLETLALAFQHTMRSSPLRRLVTYYIVDHLGNVPATESRFEPLGVLDGFAFELLHTQRSFRMYNEHKTPPYFRPLKNRELWRVAHPEGEGVNAIDGPKSYSHLNRNGPRKGNCHDCGICEGIQAFCEKCRNLRGDCFVHEGDETMFLCKECMNYNGLQSIR